jgi:hypothetical protein
MDESRAMGMAALAQEAGLSRAEQEALMERAIIGEERDYQESLRESERQRFNQYVRMTQSDDPEVQAVGFYHLQKMGVTDRNQLTPNAAADMNSRAKNIVDDVVESADSDNIAATMNQIESAIKLIYGRQSVPEEVENYVVSVMRAAYPEEYAEYLSSTLSASGS